MELKKKGFFFTMDAFMGLSLFILVLVTLYLFFISSGSLEQQYYVSEDLFDVFSNIKIEDLDLSEYGSISSMYLDGRINNTEFRISEQIIIFSSQGNDEDASLIIQDLTDGLIDERYGFSFELLQDEIFTRNIDKNLLVSRQRLLIG